MPVEGAIAERSRSLLPITWDALSQDGRYGDALLQTSINFVKDALFGTVVPPEAEAAYPLSVIDYAAKLVALELITPGIDFWMNQPTNETATGVNEQHTFVDRAEKLRLLRVDLLAETRRLGPSIEALIGSLLGYRRVRTAPPALSSMNDELLTPSPQEFPRPFAPTTRS